MVRNFMGEMNIDKLQDKVEELEQSKKAIITGMYYDPADYISRRVHDIDVMITEIQGYCLYLIMKMKEGEVEDDMA